ncbi:hypothetical protein BRE01_18520 [Brevibacillus reuszeri]|uniref:PepSY domain-containing protein n=1 Tax=Brevibacillus reuszeri TaxID=54915 RepID=A0A0K9YZW6_9BACL|nr:hypothetical protein [Brevibacillus reuszeri]KNB74278.1 hypothetical protein ADS79_00760 [Brevibacillus reuszeri]MED1856164.1 hypothetical protein [Brevibacillus reuszeri]GED68150.1 hypothetical protein BRE01_18520 [Brevibacillus reuszeri]
MKKLVYVSLFVFCCLLVGCTTQKPLEQVQGLGREEAAQIAAAAVRKYYHLQVDTQDREITLEDPSKLVDSATGKPIYKGIPVHAILKNKPVEGDIYGFHAIIEPQTKQVLSLSVDVIGSNGEKATQAIAEADLEKAAADFIRTQKLLAPTSFELVKTSDTSTHNSKRYFYYSDGQNAVAIGVDTDLQQVVTFSYD